MFLCGYVVQNNNLTGEPTTTSRHHEILNSGDQKPGDSCHSVDQLHIITFLIQFIILFVNSCITRN
ncbi:MAG: hypothetical protein JWQ30_2550 [Sediminibacterium sp.]|nr:hypothetical protein [Sediminibacterium sp.]